MSRPGPGHFVFAFVLASACASQPRPRAAPVAPSGDAPVAAAPLPAPLVAPAAPADDREWVLGDGDLELPDDTVVRWDSNEKQGLSGEHIEFARPDGVENCYLRPGDAELIENRWMLSRDAKGGRARIRPWAPSTFDLGAGGVASLKLGDRATSGAWAIEWVGVEPGTGGLTGTRVMNLRSTLEGKDTESWPYDGKLPARHEFASMQGLFHFEVEITAASFGREAKASSLALRGHVVDRATRAAYGDALDPGLYVFPDGLRVHFGKGGMWVTSLQDCTYHEFFEARAATGGSYSEEFVEISPTKSAFAFSRVFDLRAGKLVVSL